MIIYITPEQWEAIPNEYKVDKSIEHGGLRACFVSCLTPAHSTHGTNLCYEGQHFYVTDWRPERTEIEEHNGGYAVDCLESELARDFYHTGAVTVWEYPGAYDRGVEQWRLYAYKWRDEYGEDLTERELEQRLETIAAYTKNTECAGGVTV